MKNNLHQLIPPTILNQLNFNKLDLQLVVVGIAVQDRWPCLRVIVDQKIVDDIAVIDTQTLNYSVVVDSAKQSCTLDIVYYNKTNQDTVVNNQGQILENQSVTIAQLTVNGVDLVKTRLIYSNIGAYTMNLSQQKQQYFLENNINIEPSHNLSMFENGTWTIKLGLPVLSFLSQKQQQVEIAEQQDIEPILEQIYQKVLHCKTLLESQVNVQQ